MLYSERSDFECNRVGAVYIAGVSTEFVEMYFPNEKIAFFFIETMSFYWFSTDTAE